MASFQGTCFIDGVELKSFKDIPLVADHLADSPEHNLQRSLSDWNLDCAKCKKRFDFASSVNVLIKLIKCRFDYIASQLLLSLCIKATQGRQALKGTRPSPSAPERCHLTKLGC